MTQLTLSADYGSFSLVETASGQVDVVPVGLDQNLLADLNTWNLRYQTVIPADLDERGSEPLASLISRLDREGMLLASRIGAALGAGTTVKYFSEGLLRLLP